MVEAKDDEAVTYVTSKAGISSHRIVKGVDRLIYSQRSQHRGRTSITISTTRFVYRYLLPFSTWRLSLNIIPVYYILVLHWSQWGYCPFGVQSCTFLMQFYTMDISITFLFLVILSTFVEASRWSGSEQDDTLQCEGSPRISPIAWWFRGYLC